MPPELSAALSLKSNPLISFGTNRTAAMQPSRPIMAARCMACLRNRSTSPTSPRTTWFSSRAGGETSSLGEPYPPCLLQRLVR